MRRPAAAAHGPRATPPARQRRRHPRLNFCGLNFRSSRGTDSLIAVFVFLPVSVGLRAPGAPGAVMAEVRTVAMLCDAACGVRQGTARRDPAVPASVGEPSSHRRWLGCGAAGRAGGGGGARRAGARSGMPRRGAGPGAPRGRAGPRRTPTACG